MYMKISLLFFMQLIFVTPVLAYDFTPHPNKDHINTFLQKLENLPTPIDPNERFVLTLDLASCLTYKIYRKSPEIEGGVHLRLLSPLSRQILIYEERVRLQNSNLYTILQEITQDQTQEIRVRKRALLLRALLLYKQNLGVEDEVELPLDFAESDHRHLTHPAQQKRNTKYDRIYALFQHAKRINEHNSTPILWIVDLLQTTRMRPLIDFTQTHGERMSREQTNAQIKEYLGIVGRNHPQLLTSEIRAFLEIPPLALAPETPAPHGVDTAAHLPSGAEDAILPIALHASSEGAAAVPTANQDMRYSAIQEMFKLLCALQMNITPPAPHEEEAGALAGEEPPPDASSPPAQDGGDTPSTEPTEPSSSEEEKEDTDGSDGDEAPMEGLSDEDTHDAAGNPADAEASRVHHRNSTKMEKKSTSQLQADMEMLCAFVATTWEKNPHIRWFSSLNLLEAFYGRKPSCVERSAMREQPEIRNKKGELAWLTKDFVILSEYEPELKEIIRETATEELLTPMELYMIAKIKLFKRHGLQEKVPRLDAKSSGKPHQTKFVTDMIDNGELPIINVKVGYATQQYKTHVEKLLMTFITTNFDFVTTATLKDFTVRFFHTELSRETQNPAFLCKLIWNSESLLLSIKNTPLFAKIKNNIEKRKTYQTKQKRGEQGETSASKHAK